MTPRFFVLPEAVKGGEVVLSGPDAHHACRVLRLAQGDIVTVLDGAGRVMQTEVVGVAAREVRLAIRTETREEPAGPAITLVQALPKGDRFEWVLQKATELGVSAVRPVVSRRCVVRVDAGRSQQRLRRWEAIAREAAEQSERPDLPVIHPVVALDDVPWDPKDLVLILAERARGNALAARLPSTPPPVLHVLVGPEGGWDPEELSTLQARGGVCVSLGPRILRTETAGLAALAVIQAKYEG
ncbi:MAG: 16S rRNA (uracil(1498)-N(3))-methyltransferase [Candidatus Sericytochromatia bacterium]|nr:16S rRNA (uracil(1498)-N(3))-methyltransferase [Candidatus Sericytochromatia bacterium]